MSLVAYGASDDSEASDTDDGATGLNENLAPQSKSEDVGNNNNNAVADKPQAVETASAVDLSTQSNVSSQEPLNGAISDEEETSNFLKALPAPKAQHAISSVLDVTEDDELEDIVKPKPSQLADVVKPVKKQAKGRQPVKISIPALSKDLDEDEEPKKKKMKPSSHGSGLTSLLPAPKNLNLKETNRILLPHALKKTPQSSTSSREKATGKSRPTVPSAKSVQLVRGVPDSDSDEDIDTEGGSFFSLGDKTASSSISTLHLKESNSSVRLPSILGSSIPTSTPGYSADHKLDSAHGPQLPVTTQYAALQSSQPPQSVTLPVTANLHNHRTDNNSPEDLPLSFRTQASGNASLSFKSGPSVVSAHSMSYSYHQPQASNVGYQGDGYHGYPEAGESYSGASEADMEKYLQDEEFLKLQGKKARGREQVNFIDIDTNEFTGTQDLMKTLTVEQEHTSHRKKDNQPSGRQRHKHQITYLAFQAKERELTLKNQWAQNRQTKRQTQSKYGF
ncbi:proline-rich protein PRCC-like [Liolophura sinensis]|uniref:proline-rich protein PRCC-like n=1 Tax=Liolophura sinensis TaxID=3198878 RepID=UPI003158C0BB